MNFLELEPKLSAQRGRVMFYTHMCSVMVEKTKHKASFVCLSLLFEDSSHDQNILKCFPAFSLAFLCLSRTTMICLMKLRHGTTLSRRVEQAPRV